MQFQQGIKKTIHSRIFISFFFYIFEQETGTMFEKLA